MFGQGSFFHHTTMQKRPEWLVLYVHGGRVVTFEGSGTEPPVLPCAHGSPVLSDILLEQNC